MGSQVNEPLSKSPNEETFYEVECIRSHKGSKGKRLYEIKWKGYPESDNTWEPIQNLQTMLKQVDEYEKSLKQDKNIVSMAGQNDSQTFGLKMNSQSADKQAQKRELKKYQELKKAQKNNKQISRVESDDEVPHTETIQFEFDQKKKGFSQESNLQQVKENLNRNDISLEINNSTKIQDDDSIMKQQLNTSRAIIVIHKRQQCKVDSDITNPEMIKKRKYIEFIQNDTTLNEIDETTLKKAKIQGNFPFEETGNQLLDEKLSQIFHPRQFDFGNQQKRAIPKASYVKVEKLTAKKKQKTETAIEHNINRVLLDPDSLLEKNKSSNLESDPQINLDKMEELLKNIESLLSSQIPQEEHKTTNSIERNNDYDDENINKNIDCSSIQKQGIQAEQIILPFLSQPQIKQVSIENEQSIDNNHMKANERQVGNQFHIDEGNDHEILEDDDENNILVKQKKDIPADQESKIRIRSSSIEKYDNHFQRQNKSNKQINEQFFHDYSQSQKLENLNLSSQIQESVEPQVPNLSQHQNIEEENASMISEADNPSYQDRHGTIMHSEIQSNSETSLNSLKIALKDHVKQNGNISKLQSMLDSKGEQGITLDKQNKLQMMLSVQQIKVPIYQFKQSDIKIENEKLFKLLSRESEMYHMELVANSFRKDIVLESFDDDGLSSSDEEQYRKAENICEKSYEVLEYIGLSYKSVIELKNQAKMNYLSTLENTIRNDRFQFAKIKDKLSLNLQFLSLDFNYFNNHLISFLNPKLQKHLATHLHQLKGFSVHLNSQNYCINLDDETVENIIEKQNSSSSDLSGQEILHKDSQKSEESKMLIREQQIKAPQNNISRQEEILKQNKTAFKNSIITQNGSMFYKKHLRVEKQSPKLSLSQDSQQINILDDLNETTINYGYSKKLLNKNNSNRKPFLFEERNQMSKLDNKQRDQNQNKEIMAEILSIDNNKNILKQHDMHAQQSLSSISNQAALVYQMDSLQSNCLKEQNELKLDEFITLVLQENKQQKCQSQTVSQDKSIIAVSTRQQEFFIEEKNYVSIEQEQNYSNNKNINELTQDQDNQINDISIHSIDQQSPREPLALTSDKFHDESSGNKQLSSILQTENNPNNQIEQQMNLEISIEFESSEQFIDTRKQQSEQINFSEELDLQIEEDRFSKDKYVQNLLPDQSNKNTEDTSIISLSSTNPEEYQDSISSSLQTRVNDLKNALEEFRGIANFKDDIPQSIISHIVFQGQIFFKVVWKPRLKGHTNSIAIQMMPSYIESLKLQKVKRQLFNKYVIDMLSIPTRNKRE